MRVIHSRDDRSMPTFVLGVNVWRHGKDPTTDIPDLTGVSAALWCEIKGCFNIDANGLIHPLLIFLKNTDIRGDDTQGVGNGDTVEIYTGTKQYWRVLSTAPNWLNCPNQYSWAGVKRVPPYTYPLQ